MSGARLWPVLAVLFGIATFGVFVAFGQLPEGAAVYAPTEIGLAVSEFQRSTTLADLAEVFGAPADPAIIAAMDAINTLDLYAFIPAYALFLIAAALMLAGGSNRAIAWAAIFAALIGAGGDVVETYQQLQLTADYQNAATHLPMIAPSHWVKYLGIGVNGVLIAALCLLGDSKRWVLGIVAPLPLPLTAAAWAGLIDPRLFTGAVGLYWTVLLVVSIIEAVRGKGAAV